MSNIIQLETYLPHKTSEVICVKCYKRWIATRPVNVLLKELECPNCEKIGYVIETGEIIDEEENV